MVHLTIEKSQQALTVYRELQEESFHIKENLTTIRQVGRKSVSHFLSDDHHILLCRTLEARSRSIPSQKENWSEKKKLTVVKVSQGGGTRARADVRMMF